MIEHRPQKLRRMATWHAVACAGLALSLVAPAALAGSKPAAFIAESARSVPGGRAIEVTVGQAEIKPNIQSVQGVAMGFGALGAIAGAGIDTGRAKTAEGAITPLRDTLLDFDIDALAVSTTKSALSGVDWMQPTDIGFSKDPTAAGMGRYLDATPATQGAYFNYGYEMSGDFTTIKVVVSIQFANKALVEGKPKPEERFAWGQSPYWQSVVSNVTLPAPAATPAANAELWAADNGKLARQALTLAFSTVEKLIPRTLALSEDDIKAMADKEKVKETSNGYTGRVVEKTDGHLLLWTTNFVQTDTLPLAQ